MAPALLLTFEDVSVFVLIEQSSDSYQDIIAVAFAQWDILGKS